MRREAARDGWIRPGDLALLALILLVSYLLIPFVVRGFRFPVGPDASVYLWWMGLARHEGLSILGSRAGVPAAAIVVARGLGVSPVTALAGLQCALAVAVGLVTATWVSWSGGTRRAALLCGSLGGAFAVYVAAGYFSTLGVLVIFPGTLVALTVATRRATMLAAATVAATGITHPEIAALGAVVLLATAALGVRAGERAEAARVGVALAGGAAGSALLSLWLMAGPSAPVADTSRDTFLLRAGLSDLLERLYADRLLLHAWSYVPFAAVPLAIVGIRDTTGFLRRALAAWGGVTIAVIVVGAATGWFPPERAVSVALVVPVLAGLGVDRLLARGSLGMRAIAVTGYLAIVVGAGWVWWHTAPPVYEIEAARASEAARYAAAVPAGTPLVFQVTGPQPVLTFFATRAANEIRAAMPPDRIRDVYVVVPPPSSGDDEERRRLWATFEDDVRRAAERSGLDPIVFRLTPFIRGPFPAPAEGLPAEASPGVRILGDAPDPRSDMETSLSPTSIVAIFATAGGILVLLWLVGAGWVRAVTPDARITVGWAPSVGLAALVLAAVITERLGLPISRIVGSWVAIAVAAIPGWAISVIRPPRPAPGT